MSLEEQIARDAFEKLSNSEWKDGVSIILEAIRRAVAVEREIVKEDLKTAVDALATIAKYCEAEGSPLALSVAKTARNALAKVKGTK